MSRNRDGSINLVDIAPAQSVEWRTPPRILSAVNGYFKGPPALDPATTSDNPVGAERYYTPDSGEWGGLGLDWEDKFFINPPYSTIGSEELALAKRCGAQLFGLKRVTSWMQIWSAQILREVSKGFHGIALLPCGARYGTEYWQENIWSEYVTAVCWARGRVHFVDEEGQERKNTNHDSQIVLFNGNAYRFAIYFGEVGRVYKMELLA